MVGVLSPESCCGRTKVRNSFRRIKGQENGKYPVQLGTLVIVFSR